MAYKFQDKSFKWIVKYNSKMEIDNTLSLLQNIITRNKNNANIKIIENTLNFLNKAGIAYNTILIYKSLDLFTKYKQNIIEKKGEMAIISLNPSEIHCKIMKGKQIHNSWEGSRDVQSYRDKPFLFKIPSNVVLITHMFDDLLKNEYNKAINKKVYSMLNKDIDNFGIDILNNIDDLFPSEKNNMVVNLPESLCINYKIRMGKIMEKLDTSYVISTNNINLFEFLKNKKDPKFYYLSDFLFELSSSFYGKNLFIFLNKKKQIIVGKEPTYRFLTYKYNIDLLNMHAYKSINLNNTARNNTISLIKNIGYVDLDSDKLLKNIFIQLTQKKGGRKTRKKHIKNKKNTTLKKRTKNKNKTHKK